MGQVGGGKSKNTNTQTSSNQTGLDPQTQQWKDQIFQAAQGAGGSLPPQLQQALDALSGKAGANDAFMNPYQSQVIDQVNKNWDRNGQLAARGVNDAATQAHAFGGSRHGVAEGVASAQNELNRNTQVADLLNQGYTDSTNRALTSAGLASQYGSPDLWRLNVLKQGFSGLPYGQTSRGTQGTASTTAGWNLALGKK